MSKPSRLARPFFANAASKLPSSKRDDLNSKQKKISLDEKILRTGSEGNFVKQRQVQTAATPAQRKAPAHKEQGKSNLHVTSLEDAECRRTKERLSNGNSRVSVSKASRNIPRRHTLGGPRSSKEILGMQTSEMDRKREAFLEHLKQKYPHHATAIMGHQERLRDQALQCMLISLQAELDIQRYLMKIESSQRTRSPKLSHSPQPPSLGEPVEHLSETSGDSLEAMSEVEAPSPFSRGSRTRASLPVVRTTNQTKERSLGVLYLQYGDETKQLRMPNEITSADTIRALFVSAFPQQLTMKMLESPSVAIYIKDESRNVYYELNDVRNIQDRSLLKVYNKDPAHAFNHMPKTVNGDMRMQREIVYARGDGPGASRPGSTAHLPHAIPNSPPSTPVPHSMPPSPSRIPYGGTRPMLVPGNATIPRDRLSSLPVSRSISPSPSAILERRDVKPDEDMSSKNIAMYRNEGFYADPYLYHEGRMSIASSHGGHPLDVPDHIIAYHRTAIRSASAYCNPLQAEMHMEQSLYRQKSRKYPDSHLPTLGSKTPPASPHRVSDMRMDMHAHHNTHGPPHTMQPDRVSPSRQPYKKEAGTLVYIEKPRTPGLSGIVDLGPPLVEKQMFAYSTATIPKDRETRERMQAMEKQIASLTGLVQSALFKGSLTSNSKDASSEKMMKTTANKNHTDSAGTPHVSGGKTLSALESTGPFSQPLPASTSAVHLSLLDMRRSVAELKHQLQQMRQLQLQNQELLRAMMKKAELEISGKVIETMKRLEDPVQRQRVLVEQERQKYLHEEERIVRKLCELEDLVEDLKKDSASASRVVTLKDVEDGAFLLRQVGEAVASLKGEFPTLQNKMRAILRIEVEAVRFLKEEPHRLDSLLQRVRSLTDILTMLRRHVTDGLLKGTDAAQAAQYVAMEKATAAEVLKAQEEVPQASGQPLQGIAVPRDVKADVMPLTVHHAQSSPVLIQPSQLSSALLTPAQHSPGGAGPQPISPPAVAQEVTSTLQPSQAAQSPQAPVNGSAMQSLFIEEIHSASAKNRAVSIEKAERKWEEKRQNLDHYNGKEFEKLLEEAQANIMKSIPNLEMSPASGPQPKGDAPGDKPELSDSPNSEQDMDKLGGKSPPPPPPPPRRSYLPGSGLTTTRSGDVVYTSRKESAASKASSEDAGPSPQARATKCPTEEPASAWTCSSKDEEEEEEGDKIMAELQAFQKCSFMDVNSNSHAEPPRADSHVKDSRPGATVSPKEKKKILCCPTAAADSLHSFGGLVEGIFGSWRTKQPKNLEFSHEDIQKSEVECENGPQMESQKVTAGALPPGAHPVRERGMENSISDASRTSEYKTGILMKENTITNKSLLRDSRNYSQKNVSKVSSSFPGISSLEDEVSKGPKISGLQDPTSDIESQKMNYVKAKEMSQQDQETTEKCHLLSPTRSAELSICDIKTQDQEVPVTECGQVVLRHKGAWHANVKPNEDKEPTLGSPSEENAPTDNIAFMITRTAVQVLSSGEVRDIVSKKGEDVQTVNIDAKKEMTSQQGGTENEEPVVCLDKKPVIIIFDEPMDIRSAYKRLSTIFEECDEELEKMMTEEKIEEEEEEENGDILVQNNTSQKFHKVVPGSPGSGLQAESRLQTRLPLEDTKVSGGQEMNETELTTCSQADSPSSESKCDVTYDQFESPKKKFKFKFPKKQLAALTQAIRTGTKTGKKTLQVVVYEEEEEDGTLKQHKEAKRFEITRSSQPEDTPQNRLKRQEQPSPENTSPISRTDEIRKNTYRTLDSLEQTIKQLENTISEMSPKALADTSCSSNRDSVASSSHIAREASPRSLLVLEEAPTALELPSSIPSASRKASSGTPQTSRMPVPMSSKNRPGSLDKAGKQTKLQDPRQYRQANGSAKKAGGDCKPTFPSLPASKIPALSPSSGKSGSLPSASGDSSNSLNPTASKPSVTSNPLSPQTGRSAPSASLIPSVSNGSLKFQSPTHTGKGHHLSFSLQTPNGRAAPPSCSSSPPSPASPTSLNQGAKSIRTIHTPSLTSYKAQNGSSSKATPSTAKETS
ncbi:sickle tail protein homolog isoform X2 [Pteronotus mesoamericanus]|uniref:sickle tail protein homolog isoform X2 n=1 Tax=Pteronotus mesoamericanus TaxID=1884717 RepID=UPI0023EC1C2B|nr:sickle tail protein homolog isoform X2 [Pteronotus parnellii mesoamericanus]